MEKGLKQAIETAERLSEATAGLTRLTEGLLSTTAEIQRQIGELTTKVGLVEASVANALAQVCTVSPAFRANLLTQLDQVLNKYVGDTESKQVSQHLLFLRSFVNAGPMAKPYLHALKGGKNTPAISDEDKAPD